MPDAHFAAAAAYFDAAAAFDATLRLSFYAAYIDS